VVVKNKDSKLQVCTCIFYSTFYLYTHNT